MGGFMTTVFDPLHLGAVSLDVLACGHASTEALAVRQKSRLTALLSAAVRGSALYRERLQGMELGATALAALPVMSRPELRSNLVALLIMLNMRCLVGLVKTPRILKIALNLSY
jgi:hypothetical protein